MAIGIEIALVVKVYKQVVVDFSKSSIFVDDVPLDV